MELLNSLIYNGRTYSEKDMLGFKEPSEFGLAENFYGGGVKGIAMTDDDNIYLVYKDNKVIDIMIDNVKIKKEETKKNKKEETKKTEKSDALEDLTKAPEEVKKKTTKASK